MNSIFVYIAAFVFLLSLLNCTTNVPSFTELREVRYLDGAMVLEKDCLCKYRTLRLISDKNAIQVSPSCVDNGEEEQHELTWEIDEYIHDVNMALRLKAKNGNAGWPVENCKKLMKWKEKNVWKLEDCAGNTEGYFVSLEESKNLRVVEPDCNDAEG